MATAFSGLDLPRRRVTPDRRAQTERDLKLIYQAEEQRKAEAAERRAVAITDPLAFVWARPCFSCEKTGRCEHREPEVELALLEAESRRMRRMIA